MCEDYCTAQQIADAFMKLYEMETSERKALGQKARDYVLSEFNIDDTVDRWDETLTDLVENWRQVYKPWEIKEL